MKLQSWKKEKLQKKEITSLYQLIFPTELMLNQSNNKKIQINSLFKQKINKKSNKLKLNKFKFNKKQIKDNL